MNHIARIRRPLIALAVTMALSGCGGGGAGGSTVAVVSAGAPTPDPNPTPTPTPTPTPAPAPIPTPTPTPAPAPSPTPTPTPAPTLGLHGVVAEGDSISVFWGGNYTGIYAAAHPSVEFHGSAVGGSGINNPGNGNGLMQRLPADLALHPAVVTVLIGANDLGAAASPEAWLDALWTYVAAVKATGAKVLVGTVLPIQIATNPTYTALHNSRRVVVNAAIRAAVGTKIDGVADYASDPVMGPDAAAADTRLYADGVHPTDGASSATTLDGQRKLAAIYAPALDRILGQ